MRAWVFVVLAACGRVGFDAPDDSRLNVDDAGESNYRKAVMGDGPVAYWRLGEVSGTVARDEIGGNDGTWEGGIVRVPGAVNDGDVAVKLDGMTGRCEIGDVFRFAGTAPQTIELWAVRDTIDSRASTMVERSSIAVPQDGWQVYTGDDFTLYSRVVADVEFGYAPATPFVPGVWRYVVATYDGNESAMYIDGAYVGGMMGQPIADVPGILVFGDRAEEQFYKYDGTLDEIAIYDRALTPAQIQTHYAASGR